jgi:D-beta-D-heptose 7-phosphate kinase/D-beta-D-heptose 1-phosphate adenosyltransferase
MGRAMGTIDEPAEALAAFPRARILVVGDVMLDRFVYGTVERISPEAPVPVVRVERESVMLGGAGNVARNVAGLGARATLLSLVGDDSAGHEVQALIASETALDADLVVEPGRPTTVKTRYVSGSHQLLRADRETARAVGELGLARLIAAFEAALDDHDVVVLSDYAKGVLSDEALPALIARADARGLPVIADPKHTDFTRYRGVSLIKPNRKELIAATRVPALDDGEIEVAARIVQADAGIPHVLVTRGERGMTLVGPDGALDHLPTRAREVFDVSGAGDTVLATLATAIAAGASPRAAAQLANLAAGIVVGKVGTAPIRLAELAAALAGGGVGTSAPKVVSADEAADIVAGWRALGLKVGFTNGCFDLIHPGHVSLLGQARAACDRLVVGVNTDESVRRLKGPTRPVQDETARATVLAALAPVDLVVPFAEHTPIELIRALRPDVLVKGADYTVETVVGADLVQSYGGRVLLAELSAGHSTTATIGRMAGG